MSRSSSPPPEGPPDELTDEAARRLAGELMRGQARLGGQVAFIFLAVVLGLPLANALAPEWSRIVLLGFPLPWLLLGIVFYPVCWLLSYVFVQRSEDLERRETERLGSRGPGS